MDVSCSSACDNHEVSEEAPELQPKRGAKSPVWIYFGIETQSGDKVICHECR